MSLLSLSDELMNHVQLKILQFFLCHKVLFRILLNNNGKNKVICKLV